VSTTTEQLLALAKEAADLTNVADYVTDPTWISWLNSGVSELHRFVTNKFKATFYREYNFTLTAGQSQVTLPSNFWRLKGLDVDPDTPLRRTVRPYNFQDRNLIRQNQIRDFDPLLYAPNRFYNVIGSSLLRIQPQEAAAGNYRLYYVPKPKVLAAVRDIAVVTPATDSIAVVAGIPEWGFQNFNLDTVNDLGGILTVSGATNPVNNGSRTLTAIIAVNGAQTDGAATNEIFPNGTTATVARCLDSELEPYAEYVWLTAAIKSLIKEESYQQAKALAEQRNLIREDLTEALETDQGGPQTIVDTDDWGTDL